MTRLLLLPLALVFLTNPHFAKADSVEVPAGLEHQSFSRLLEKYVDDRGLVAYAAWRKSPDDRKALEQYLRQYRSKPNRPAKGDAEVAGLINLYNGLILDFILDHPTRSIQALNKPFDKARHPVAGRMVALNEIEHDTLRPLIGYRAHAVLVCAAQSCPPLQRTAYTPADLNPQINRAYKTWLAREDLNKFNPERRTAEISSIFKWFAADFEKAGGTKRVLAKYGPDRHRDFLRRGQYEISYKPYRWGLNDQQNHGSDYSRLRLYWDRIIDTMTFWN